MRLSFNLQGHINIATDSGEGEDQEYAMDRIYEILKDAGVEIEDLDVVEIQ